MYACTGKKGASEAPRTHFRAWKVSGHAPQTPLTQSILWAPLFCIHPILSAALPTQTKKCTWTNAATIKMIPNNYSYFSLTVHMHNISTTCPEEPPAYRKCVRAPLINTALTSCAAGVPGAQGHVSHNWRAHSWGTWQKVFRARKMFVLLENL